MCWECGRRCLLCGEPSRYVIEVPELNAMIPACEEHREELCDQVDDHLAKMAVAHLN